MRPLAALIAGGLALACGFAFAGCGGSASETKSESTTAAPPGTLEALWRASGVDVAIVPGTSDFAPGTNRVSFLIVDKQSRLVERPTARVWMARGLRQKPYQQTLARLEPIGVPGGAEADAQNIYVAYVDTPRPGTYWLLAEPVGGRAVQALGNVVVRKEPAAPAIGDRAIPVQNPTVAGGRDPKSITTARPPDTELLQTSVAQALTRKQPFVVTFSTPLYCQTRTCGPVVQVVQAVAARWQGEGVAFIHVEVYEGNDPAKGTNRWVDAWRLPTEPFTFVVDRGGVIRAKLEGAFSTAELERAVRKVVPAKP
jgi:hypothetical protein